MRIYLRPITAEDGPSIVKWRNSSVVKNHVFDRTPLTLESNRKFFENYVMTGRYKQFIVERVDEDYGAFSYPIATAYLKDMDKINHRCQLCIFTSDDQEWNTESQSMAVKLLLEKAFEEYGMNKVFSYVFAANSDEIELLEKAGLTKEALLRNEALNMKMEYVDIVRMCIFRDDYERGKA